MSLSNSHIFLSAWRSAYLTNFFNMTAIFNTAFDIQVNSFVCKNIPYIKYFELCSYEKWSLHYYVSMLIKNYKFAKKKEAYRNFYKDLHNIKNDLSISKDVQNIAQNLIKNSKVSIFRIFICLGELFSQMLAPITTP